MNLLTPDTGPGQTYQATIVLDINSMESMHKICRTSSSQPARKAVRFSGLGPRNDYVRCDARMNQASRCYVAIGTREGT
jgi:hypothetical protein